MTHSRGARTVGRDVDFNLDKGQVNFRTCQQFNEGEMTGEDLKYMHGAM